MYLKFELTSVVSQVKLDLHDSWPHDVTHVDKVHATERYSFKRAKFSHEFRL